MLSKREREREVEKRLSHIVLILSYREVNLRPASVDVSRCRDIAIWWL